MKVKPPSFHSKAAFIYESFVTNEYVHALANKTQSKSKFIAR
jgi:hypothetical protein